MKRNISDIAQCANCGACLNTCPVDAIRIDDRELFYRPVVDGEKCISCGKCTAVCPVENPVPRAQIRGAWWGRHKDPDHVKNSSSGGAFTALADCILADGGVVFGACYDEQHVIRIRSTDDVTLDALRKSKYVESLPGFSFREAEEKLRSGRKVLFCGTPCQIAGLKNYLRTDYENLYTCDFTCGGLPSHGLFQQYLELLEEKYGSKVTKVDFRPKVYGWSTHAIRVYFANGKKYVKSAVFDPFFCGFIAKHVNTRDYCYDCKFAEHHAADIILADFWCYEKIVGERAPEDGISLVLANSQKGEDMLRRAAQVMALHPLDIPAASYNLKKREYSESYMAVRREYLRCCTEQGLEAAVKVIPVPRGIKAVYVKMRHFLKGVVYKA